jgi:FkbM family methyltransferase
MKQLLAIQTVHGLEKIGSAYGGWIVPTTMLDESWICYDGGVGEDLTFADGLIARYGCQVFGFDPTPRAVAYAESFGKSHHLFTFRPFGLWSSSQRLSFFAPRDPQHVSHSVTDLQGTSAVAFVADCRSIPDVMRELGHERIDLLKLDIEGAEFEVLTSVLDSLIRPTIICVEFDQPSSLRRIWRMVERIKRAGYALVAVDRWNCTFVHLDRMSTDGTVLRELP